MSSFAPRTVFPGHVESRYRPWVAQCAENTGTKAPETALGDQSPLGEDTAALLLRSRGGCQILGFPAASHALLLTALSAGASVDHAAPEL